MIDRFFHRFGRSWGCLISLVLAFLVIGAACVVLDILLFPEFVGPAVISPDGRYLARVHESNCGATCSFSAWVEIQDRTGPWFRRKPSTELAMGNMHPCTIILAWEDARHLRISYPTNVQPETTRSNWRNVAIHYVSRATAPSDITSAYDTPSAGQCYGQWLRHAWFW